MNITPALSHVSSQVALIEKLQENMETLIASFLSFGALMWISFYHFPQLVQIGATVGLLVSGAVILVALMDFYWIRWVRLRRLAGDEKHTLNAFVHGNKKTIHWFSSDDKPMSLAADGIIRLVKLEETPEGGYAWYTIRSSVFEYLRKHPDLVEPHD